MTRLTGELSELFAKSHELEAQIKKQLGAIGYEIWLLRIVRPRQWKNGLAFKKIDFSSDGEPVIKIAELKNGITGQTQFTEGDYGDDNTIVEFQKMDFCEYICSLDSDPLKAIFANLKKIIDMLATLFQNT